MRLPSTLITVSLVLLVLPSAVVAQAADEVEDMRARRHYEAGTAYYEVGDYDSALRELERSYEISRRPPLLFNLYMTEERLGHFARAAERLERYLAEGGPRSRTAARSSSVWNVCASAPQRCHQRRPRPIRSSRRSRVLRRGSRRRARRCPFSASRVSPSRASAS
jgi:hypothetical protein